MRHKQAGISLFGLLMLFVVLGILTGIAFKIVPAVHEYYAIKKNAKTVATGAADKSILTIQEHFDKLAMVDSISAIQGRDLDIAKGQGSVKIAFSYEKRIPLSNNVSLVINFRQAVVGN